MSLVTESINELLFPLLIMNSESTSVSMAVSVKPIKISEREYKRIQAFGLAGESINTALMRALDIAEKHRGNK